LTFAKKTTKNTEHKGTRLLCLSFLFFPSLRFLCRNR